MMKVKVILISLCCAYFFPLFAQGENNVGVNAQHFADTLVLESVKTLPAQAEIKPFEPVALDSRIFTHNPLFLDLVFMGIDVQLDWKKDGNFLSDGKPPRTLSQPFDPIETQHPIEILTRLRNDARSHITRTAPGLYRTTIDQLPNVNWRPQQETVETLPMERLTIDENFFTPVVASNRIVIQRRQFSHWQNRANALLQFSQTSFSENWHQGGNDFFALLGVMSARFNYDNRSRVKWDNNFEWGTGFNTIDGDSLRRAVPNDDLLRAISNFNVKATGDFFYNASMEFQTHFFNNPRAINSREMRVRFLTPIRFNAGIGMDYRRKNLSVAFSPVSFRYIYLTVTEPTADGFFINPKTFGIPEGENELREFGSRLVVGLRDYRPVRNEKSIFHQLTINSRFNFFTNYERVEIDWEIIAELAINRFFSTRLMLNPRFDNTAILAEDERARIQMRQMLTVGFSYRFL